MRTAAAVCLSLAMGVALSGCISATTREKPTVLVTSAGQRLYSASTPLSVGDSASASEARLLLAAAATARMSGGSHFVVVARDRIQPETIVERPGYLQMTYIRGQQIPISIPAATRTIEGREAITFRILILRKGAPLPSGALPALAPV